MTTNPLPEILQSVAKKMAADFDAAARINHKGSRGTAREEILLGFLDTYLTKNVLPVQNGEVVSVDGQRSGQCDILIRDALLSPFLSSKRHQIIPAEGLYGVIEVKSRLTCKELRDACRQIRLVKELPKLAYGADAGGQERTHAAYGKTWPFTPTSGIVFAYDSVSLPTLAAELQAQCADIPTEQWPDSVWVLKRGFINWINPFNGKLDVAPHPAAGMLTVNSRVEGDVLLPLVAHLHEHFATAWMRPFRLLSYLQDNSVGWGTVQKQFWQHPSSNGKVWLNYPQTPGGDDDGDDLALRAT